jgi:hypothetical protein
LAEALTALTAARAQLRVFQSGESATVSADATLVCQRTQYPETDRFEDQWRAVGNF